MQTKVFEISCWKKLTQAGEYEAKASASSPDKGNEIAKKDTENKKR